MKIFLIVAAFVLFVFGVVIAYVLIRASQVPKGPYDVLPAAAPRWA